jgi:hypothetical protein
VVSLVLDGVLTLPREALAYIDPNTGNLIFQILFPIFTAIATGYLICKNAIRRKIYGVIEWLRNRTSYNKESNLS